MEAVRCVGGSVSCAAGNAVSRCDAHGRVCGPIATITRCIDERIISSWRMQQLTCTAPPIDCRHVLFSQTHGHHPSATP
jgi:hypothetical protein